MAGLSGGHGVSIGRLTADDVDGAAALSRTIGWNQTVADWGRLVTTPGSEVFNARSGGDVVGTASLVRYGASLGWLGMVIVHPDLRGRGLGAALVDHVLAAWDAAPGAAPGALLGLDATEFGAPLYLRRGFTPVATIDRWLGPTLTTTDASRSATGLGGVSVRSAGADDRSPITDFDLLHAGVDRSALLHRLVAESVAGPVQAGAAAVRVFVAERAAELVGYAAVRPGRERPHIGPLVAADDSVVTALLDAVTDSSATGAYLDAVRDPHRTRLLTARGFELARTLQRMARVPRSSATQAERDLAATAPPLSAEALMAAMGFEWG